MSKQANPNFPRMVFPADCVIDHNGPSSHRTVKDDDELQKALDEGCTLLPPSAKPEVKPEVEPMQIDDTATGTTVESPDGNRRGNRRGN